MGIKCQHLFNMNSPLLLVLFYHYLYQHCTHETSDGKAMKEGQEEQKKKTDREGEELENCNKRRRRNSVFASAKFPFFFNKGGVKTHGSPHHKRSLFQETQRIQMFVRHRGHKNKTAIGHQLKRRQKTNLLMRFLRVHRGQLEQFSVRVHFGITSERQEPQEHCAVK